VSYLTVMASAWMRAGEKRSDAGNRDAPLAPIPRPLPTRSSLTAWECSDPRGIKSFYRPTETVNSVDTNIISYFN